MRYSGGTRRGKMSYRDTVLQGLVGLARTTAGDIVNLITGDETILNALTSLMRLIRCSSQPSSTA